MQPYTSISQQQNVQEQPITLGLLFTPNVFKARSEIYQDEAFFESPEWFNFINTHVNDLFTRLLPTFECHQHQKTLDAIHRSTLPQIIQHVYSGYLWDRNEISTPAMLGQVSLTYALRLHYLLVDLAVVLKPYQTQRPAILSIQLMKNKDCMVHVYFTAHHHTKT